MHSEVQVELECSVCVHMCICTCIWRWMCTHMQVHVCAGACMCRSMYVQVHIEACAGAYVYRCMCMHVFVCASTCVCKCMCDHVQVHVSAGMCACRCMWVSKKQPYFIVALQMSFTFWGMFSPWPDTQQPGKAGWLWVSKCLPSWLAFFIHWVINSKLILHAFTLTTLLMDLSYVSICACRNEVCLDEMPKYEWRAQSYL